MKLKMMRGIGRGLHKQLSLDGVIDLHIMREHAVCDVPDGAAAVLVERKLAEPVAQAASVKKVEPKPEPAKAEPTKAESTK